MREVKFRAWDKVANKIHEYGSDEACELWEDGCDMMGMSFISCQPNIEWIQYTGLKDKNGKEIYEGDILKCVSVDGQVINNGIIEFVGCDYTLEFKERSAEGFYYLHHILMDKAEVIGNIYENPELLEV